jgi:hypothetical protein
MTAFQPGAQKSPAESGREGKTESSYLVNWVNLRVSDAAYLRAGTQGCDSSAINRQRADSFCILLERRATLETNAA